LVGSGLCRAAVQAHVIGRWGWSTMHMMGKG